MPPLEVVCAPRRKWNHWPGLLALGTSFALHAVALGCFLVFREVTPPEPHAAIAVDLVRIADMAQVPGRPHTEKSQSSQFAQKDPVRMIQSDSESEPIAEESPVNDTAIAFSVPETINGPKVERVRQPGRDRAQEPMAVNNTSGRIEAGPEAPKDPVPVADNQPVPEVSIDATLSAFSVPRRRPQQLQHSTEPKTARRTTRNQLATFKSTPPQPMGKKPLRQPVDKTFTQPERTVENTLKKSAAIAALPSTIRKGGAPDDRSMTLPNYRDGGLSNDPPRYPYLARRRGWEGKVVLRVLVTAEGEARTVRLLQSSGYRLLDKSAISAVKKWRFVPASRGGSPVAGSVDLPVSFKLTK